ncbi:hypothetical protein LWM68_41340 [Niabella sp. W65]|nr:hypothetical protein [Niabella sp. W65]MCH7368617.1 hypothetical protein [Niabella sp. W65]
MPGVVTLQAIGFVKKIFGRPVDQFGCIDVGVISFKRGWLEYLVVASLPGGFACSGPTCSVLAAVVCCFWVRTFVFLPIVTLHAHKVRINSPSTDC